MSVISCVISYSQKRIYIFTIIFQVIGFSMFGLIKPPGFLNRPDPRTVSGVMVVLLQLLLSVTLYLQHVLTWAYFKLLESVCTC